MKYCHICGLEIEDDISICPLCKAKQHDFIRPDGTKVQGFIEPQPIVEDIPPVPPVIEPSPIPDVKPILDTVDEKPKEEKKPIEEENKIPSDFKIDEPKKKKPKKTLAIILIVILAILVLGGGGAGIAIAISNNSSQNSQDSESPSDDWWNPTTTKKTTTKKTTTKKTTTKTETTTITTTTTTTDEEKIWLFEEDRMDLYFVSTGTVELYQYVLDDNTGKYVATLCYCGYWDMVDTDITINWTEWYYDYDSDPNSYIGINLNDSLHLTDSGVYFDYSSLSSDLTGKEFIQKTVSAYYNN